MSGKIKYRVPDYYPSFSCKCGECRHTCCQQWCITLSLEEYDRLLGLECSPGLKRSLDIAAYPLERPQREKYASMTERPDGFCRLLSDDGWCMLQRECGEGALPCVCRLYPRSPRTKYSNECSCSAGCEAVSEALYRHLGPLDFVFAEYDYGLPAEPAGEITEDEYTKVRAVCFEIMRDEKRACAERLIDIGKCVFNYASKKDTEKAVSPSQTRSAAADSRKTEIQALEFQRLLNAKFGKKSISLRDYSDYADDIIFCGQETEPSVCEQFEFEETVYKNRSFAPTKSEPVVRYEAAKARLESVYPKIDVFAGRLLTNHMFYTGFPFSLFGANAPKRAYMSLCALYALLRFVWTGCLCGENGENELIDTTAAVFRMAENSAFIENAPLILRKVGEDTEEALEKIIFYF
ncbi:MAG: flagellin lysine-N-methylase [Firmicutes bacterium]|nr:flagellin lysine-N-methylase [Bacillota bacterium]